MLDVHSPIMQTYLITASMMALKILLQAWVTVYRMIKVNGGFLHPEDIRKTRLNSHPNESQLEINNYVERSRSMQRNDMESVPVFMIIGYLFILTQPALWLVRVLMYGYVLSRLLHAYALGMAKTHDLRATFWSIGSLIVIGMSIYVLIFAIKG